MTFSPFRVGLTGGIGSGKTVVSDFLNELGVEIIDADIIARQIAAPGSPIFSQIIERFGPSLQLDNGQLDRSALRKRIFANEPDRIDLEKIMHPAIRSEMEQRAQNSRSDYVTLVIPLLVESGLLDIVDFVASVEAPLDLRKSRVMKRDETDEDAVDRVLSVQGSESDRRAHADAIIMNTGNLEDLREEIRHLHHQILAHMERLDGH